MGEIWQSLHLASRDLDRALENPACPVEADLDLYAASYALHRALVSLGRVEMPVHWRPPRVVALTCDEAVVTMGVIELLCDGSAAPPWLAALARSSMEKLRARVGAVGGVGFEGWAEVLED